MEDIIRFLNENGREEFSQGIELIKESYYSSSIISDVIDASDYGGSDIHDFKKLGKAMNIPVEWFNDPSQYLEILFNQLGGGVSLGEEIHLVNELIKQYEGEIRFLDITADIFIRNILNLVHRRGTTGNITVFLPIEFHNRIYIDWLENPALNINHSTGQLSVGSYPFKVIWSNKYNEFSKIVILKSNFGRWICSPNVENRLIIRPLLVERNTTVQLIVETIFDFNILDENLLTIIHPTNLETN